VAGAAAYIRSKPIQSAVCVRFCTKLVSCFPKFCNTCFQLPLPMLEKLARPVVVYLVLVVLLRIFGKRELAQLNPSTLWCCCRSQIQCRTRSSVTTIRDRRHHRAFGLLAINWIVVRILFRSGVDPNVGGRSAVLIRNGQLDAKASIAKHSPGRVAFRNSSPGL